MASIYNYQTGDEITVGLSSYAAEEAARRIAQDTNQYVVIQDYDGVWIVEPSGECRRPTAQERADGALGHEGDGDDELYEDEEK